MTAAHVFLPPNPLAKAVRDGEGPSTRQLVADAERRVEALGVSTRKYVQLGLQSLLAYRASTNDELLADLPTIEGHALGIAEVAGAVGLQAIGAVTGGIVAMADAYSTGGIWHPKALRLHLDALVPLAGETGPQQNDHAVLIGRLLAMRASLGVVE